MGNSLHKVLPGLYISNVITARNEAVLDKYSITHILSIHENTKPKFQDRVYLCINMRDTCQSEISVHFQDTNDFIHRGRNLGGNVLVHCFAGVSRSVSVLVAYLMSATSLNVHEALRVMKYCRPTANPNYGFVQQLIAFSQISLNKERERLASAHGCHLYEYDDQECRWLLQEARQHLGYQPLPGTTSPPEPATAQQQLDWGNCSYERNS